MNQALSFVFFLHDTASALLAKHLLLIKRLILLGAHLALLGFFFPGLRKDFGELAINLLLVILFLSPASKIFRTRLLLQLMGLRRELGITMGYLATIHGLGYLLDPAWFTLLITPDLAKGLSFVDPALLAGFITYCLTLPLLFTSNAWAQRTLGGAKWKLLHRLVYGVFFFALFHRYLIRGGDSANLIQVILLLFAYGLAKVLAWKNFLMPLQKSIDWVAGEYRVYTEARRAAKLVV